MKKTETIRKENGLERGELLKTINLKELEEGTTIGNIAFKNIDKKINILLIINTILFIGTISLLIVNILDKSLISGILNLITLPFLIWNEIRLLKQKNVKINLVIVKEGDMVGIGKNIKFEKTFGKDKVMKEGEIDKFRFINIKEQETIDLRM